MPYPLITTAQLRTRVGPHAHDRVFDDDEEGVFNPEAEEQLRKDASGKVLGRLGGSYDVDAIRGLAAEDTPDELVRITLDVAQAMMAIRCPNIMDVDGHRLMRRADEDLQAIRLNKAGLGVTTTPEPPSNEGAEVFGRNPDLRYEPEPHTFLGGFGDFG